MGGRGKYTSLTLEQKIKILIEVDKGEKKKREIAKEYGIRPNTLSTYIHNKNKIWKSWRLKVNNKDDTRKRLRDGDHPLVDACVKQWLTEVYDQNILLNGSVIRKKAKEFGEQMGLNDFKASSGWLMGFRERNGISFKKTRRCYLSSSGSQLREWTMNVANVLRDYEIKNVYSLDEMGLFYDCSPEKTHFYKDEKCREGEKSQERFTVLVATNMDGSDKLPVLLIGSSNIMYYNVKSLPVKYISNSKSWITNSIFVKWLTQLDYSMVHQSRKIVLFLNSKSVHSDLPNLTAIKVVYFPNDIIDIFNPMNRIKSEFRKNYRRFILRSLLESSMNGKPKTITPVQGIRNVYKAWKSISKDVIAESFERAKFRKISSSSDDSNISSADDPLAWQNSSHLSCRLIEYHPLIDVVEPTEWKEYSSRSNEYLYSSYRSFVIVDEDISVCDESSHDESPCDKSPHDESIFMPVCGDDVEEKTNVPPTNVSDVNTMLNSLRTFVESQVNVTNQVFDALDLIDDFLYQSNSVNT